MCSVVIIVIVLWVCFGLSYPETFIVVMELIFEIVELYFARALRDAQSRVAAVTAQLLQHDIERGETHAYSTDEEYHLAWTRTYLDLQGIRRSAAQEAKQAGEAWHLWRRAWNRICP